MASQKRSDTSSVTNDIPSSIRNAGADAARMYARLLREGYGHRWAEMCALQTPPGVRGTDRTLMEGKYSGGWLDRMPADTAAKIVNEARAAGINISGKFYCSGLADQRAHRDPAAWIDSVGDIKRVAEVRDLEVTGAVEHRASQKERRPSKKLSERLIRHFSRIEKKNHPGKKAGELREIVIDKYAPKWKNR